MGLGDPKGRGGTVVSVIFVPVSRDAPARVEGANDSFLGGDREHRRRRWDKGCGGESCRSLAEGIGGAEIME